MGHPDLDQAGDHMREIFRRSSSVLMRAQQGVADMRERHSPQAAASSMHLDAWSTSTPAAVDGRGVSYGARGCLIPCGLPS